jgi:hypothetical protein
MRCAVTDIAKLKPSSDGEMAKLYRFAHATTINHPCTATVPWIFY